jgi:hypothetical protein
LSEHLTLSKKEVLALALNKVVKEGESYWPIYFVGPHGFTLDARFENKQDMMDIWRNAPGDAKYAIIQADHRFNYIVVDMLNISWFSTGKRDFRHCWEFEDLDQAIMACALGALG